MQDLAPTHTVPPFLTQRWHNVMNEDGFHPGDGGHKVSRIIDVSVMWLAYLLLNSIYVWIRAKNSLLGCQLIELSSSTKKYQALGLSTKTVAEVCTAVPFAVRAHALIDKRMWG